MKTSERLTKIKDFLCAFSPNVEFNQDYHTAYSLNELSNKFDNLFFCGGVKTPKTGGVKRNTEAKDIGYKNYFVIDIDLRKNYAKLNGCSTEDVTDEQVYEQINSLKDVIATDKLLSQWTKIVFTGNGCHIYYWGKEWKIGEELSIEEYYEGVMYVYKSWNKFLDNLCGEFNYFYTDNSTANVDRILRLPYSYNAKPTNPGGRKIPVKILYEQDVWSDMLGELKEYSGLYREYMKTINSVEYKDEPSVKVDSGFMNAFVDVCDKIPIRDVLDKLGVRYSGHCIYEGDRKTSGWKIWNNCVVNFSDDVSDEDRPKGGCYSFVKKYLKHEKRKETINWFKDNFREVLDWCDKNRDKFKKPEGDVVIPIYSYSRQDKAYYFANPIFDKYLGCIYKGELATIVAEGNSGKTTFALDMILRNTQLGSKCFYLNLEFPLGITFEKKRQDKHGKTKISMTELTDNEKADLDKYVKGELAKFDNDTMVGIGINDLIKKLIDLKSQGYELVFVDTFSKIDGNMGSDSWNSQNKSMILLQDFVGKTGMSIILLHHTNKRKEFSGSNKIFDLSNVFITISIANDIGPNARLYELKKDKNTSNVKIYASYEKGEYIFEGEKSFD